ncbi:aldehyde dehydrogenase family protein [Mechercharimyces sp. CAU 1602]|uniref:aldehyde dehydrogenase family protein n=1 Tax=Mechercharimyces sp. CAU 1602 TaxID=2973933 RepID=UPI002161D0F4|nr:aldehyde dehydrogenase family protein [Mechercharimyces sp. CAU 1602]MCS1350117.1 aldehyde dehydrogenase family protein [Mechercharimyces sp. CAU 1602]
MGTIQMSNPATGEVIGQLHEKTEVEVHEAMRHARNAFPAWRQTPLTERIEYIKQLRIYLVQHAEEIADKIVADTGKTRVEALMTEVYASVEFLKYYEKEAPSILKTRKVRTPLALFGHRSEVQYRPMGAVAVISPWNYPLQLSLVPVVSALLAGNTVLLKPSEVTPLTGVLMEEALASSGLPRHVVQVIHGGKSVGQHLIESLPDKIFFTGSVATGKKIMAHAAEHLIPVSMELGGKDPMIVFADADLNRAINGALWGGLTNAGQTCISVERLYVQFEIYGAVATRLREQAEELQFYNGHEGDIGSMTDPRQVEIVEEQIRDAVEKGATILCGGKRTEPGSLYFEPTVIVDVDDTMKIATEETFGPVIVMMPFHTEEQAIQLANHSTYGLSASVWTKDLNKAHRISNQLECGSVGINNVIVPFANPHMPFGGVKHSGIGRYHGPEGLYAFCHTTSVMVNKGTKKRELHWYPYTKEAENAIRSLIRSMYGDRFRLSKTELKNIWKQFRRQE